MNLFSGLKGVRSPTLVELERLPCQPLGAKLVAQIKEAGEAQRWIKLQSEIGQRAVTRVREGGAVTHIIVPIRVTKE